MTGYTTDDLLDLLHAKPGKRRQARAELEALLASELQRRRPPPASNDEVARLVAAIADMLTRPFADVATRKYHPDEEKRCGYAADVIDDLLDAPAVRKPRGRGRPKGSLSPAQRRKQEIVSRAVDFWIRYSKLDLSAAPPDPFLPPKDGAYEFAEAFYAAVTGQKAVRKHGNEDRSVERQFERAVRPWIEEAKARGQKSPGK